MPIYGKKIWIQWASWWRMAHSIIPYAGKKEKKKEKKKLGAVSIGGGIGKHHY